MKRFWIMLLAVALALVIALPVGAMPSKCDETPNLPGCAPRDEDPPITAKSIAVYMDDEPLWTHEGADIVKYNVTLQNKTDTNIEGVTVEFTAAVLTETETVGVISANASETVGFRRSVEDFPEAELCLSFEEDACELFASVKVYVGTELVADETMSTPLYPDPPCNFYEPATYGEVSGEVTRGEVTRGEVCIWVPPETGEWTVSAVPNPIPTRPTRLMMTMRDGVPGNWCTLTAGGDGGVVQERWLRDRPDTDPVVLDMFLPGDNGVLDDGMCLTGGHGVCTEDDCYFAVGNPKSFYLYSSFDATVTLTHHPSD
jgi:hypothetical protein